VTTMLATLVVLISLVFMGPMIVSTVSVSNSPPLRFPPLFFHEIGASRPHIMIPTSCNSQSVTALKMRGNSNTSLDEHHDKNGNEDGDDKNDAKNDNKNDDTNDLNGNNRNDDSNNLWNNTTGDTTPGDAKWDDTATRNDHMMHIQQIQRAMDQMAAIRRIEVERMSGNA
jgi:hypothetical protein